MHLPTPPAQAVVEENSFVLHLKIIGWRDIKDFIQIWDREHRC